MDSAIFTRGLFLVLLLVLPGCVGAAFPGQRTAGPEIDLTEIRGSDSDLPAFRAVDLSTGAVFRAYYDAEARATVREIIPTIAQLYSALGEVLHVDPGHVNWAAVAFVNDPDYVPPRERGEVRWTIEVESNGDLGYRGREDLFRMLPHEQVHAVQSTLQPGLPRWFAEGLAEWAGLIVTERWAPDLAEARRAELEGARAALRDSLRLGSWGGMTVKREALLRQVTPEQRARMEAEPTYVPPGPFSFGPADLLSDESNAPARYGGALALFEAIERDAGPARMRDFLRAVWESEQALDTDRLVALAREHAGFDVVPWLR